MIFVFEPQNAIVTPPEGNSALNAQYLNNDPIYQEGLFTYTLTQGANIISPTPTINTGDIDMSSPTMMKAAGITVVPSSISSMIGNIDVDSTKNQDMMITRPANPIIPNATTLNSGLSASSTVTSSSSIPFSNPEISLAANGNEEASPSNNKSSSTTMQYNHTTLIVILILLCLSILAIGLWYFKKSRTRKIINNHLEDLENNVQEKRLSISKALTNSTQRRSWIKLNEEIINNNEFSKSSSTSPSPTATVFQDHQNEKADIIKQEKHDSILGTLTFPKPTQTYSLQQTQAYQIPPQVYDYNQSYVNKNTQIETILEEVQDNNNNRLSSSTYNLNKRNSTINYFPEPPSNIPLPPLPPTPQAQANTSDPEIGLATTTYLPASSSRSAVAVDAYPGRLLTGSGRDLAKISGDDIVDVVQQKIDSESDSPKRNSLPYVLPVQEAERTPRFISLSQMNHEKKSPDYRSPTESLYVIYKDRQSVVP
ncbi:uncharacterized protein L201_007716 [Kwoniella dendrophila CBS 6074]|uniref:Uncharacterized protein n=1 Tax=Kwoniella dendrophila CBS 6074 TaxID=1295534 RepID=A0AAX4K7B1_9TREE